MATHTRNSKSRIMALLRLWWNWRSKRFWLLILVLVYALAGFLGTPWLIRKQVSDTFAGTGRSARIAGLAVNPFTFTLQAVDARIQDADGKALLSFDEMFVNFELSSLFHWAWTFDEVRLTGLDLFEERFVDRPSRYAGLVEALRPPPAPDPSPGTTGLPRLIIHHFRLIEGRFGLVDHPAGDFEGAFGPVRVEIDGLRTLPDHSGRQAVSITTPGGGQVEWQGDIGFYPFESSGRLSVTDRALNASLHYANYYLPVSISQDGVELTCDYRLSLPPEGLALAVDHLDIALFGARIVPAGQETPIFEGEEIRLRGGSLRWPERTFSAAAFSFHQPAIGVGRAADGRFNFEPLRPQPDAAGAEQERPSGWLVSLGEVTVNDGEIRIGDETVEPPLELSLLEWQSSLRGVDNRPGTVMPAHMSLRLSSGGTIDYEGNLTVLPGVKTEGDLKIRQAELDVAQPYVNTVLRADLQRGTLDLAGRVLSGPDQPLDIAGNLAVYGFEASDRSREERLIGWRKFELDRFNLNLAESYLRSSKLALDGFYGRLRVAEDLTTNISDLIVRPEFDQETANGDAAGGEAGSIAVSVDGLGISDGTLDFSDYSLPIPFEARIAALQGELSTLTTIRGDPGTLSLEGQVNEYGLARIGGTIDLLAFDQHSDIEMDFRNLEVSRLSPYVAQFAGYLIEDGRLDADFDYQLTGRKLSGDSKLVIRQLKLGNKLDDPKAGSLPLGLAVALLKDANGVIGLDIPLSGDLDNPQFSVSGLIWKALGNLITKAVTAPFRLLGRLVGADSEDFGRIAFPPGTADISPPDREKLAKLAAAMAQRPQLMLKISGAYAPRADGHALKVQRVDAAIAARKNELLETSGEVPSDGDRRAMEALFAEAFPETPLDSVRREYTTPESEEETGGVLDKAAYLAALRQRLIDSEEVGDEELQTLAEARAAAVVAALAAQSGPAAERPDRTVRGEPVAVAGENGASVPLELAVTTGQ